MKNIKSLVILKKNAKGEFPFLNIGLILHMITSTDSISSNLFALMYVLSRKLQHVFRQTYYLQLLFLNHLLLLVT